MPVWLLVADVVLNLVGETELSGRWLYVSIVAGALICAGAIVASSLSMLKRILLVFGSWLLLAAKPAAALSEAPKPVPAPASS